MRLVSADSYFRSPSSLCMVFDSISSIIDDVLSIHPSAVFVFGDCNAHHKYWLTYFGGTNRSGEPILFFDNFLLKWLTLLLRYQTLVLTVLLFWIHLFLLKLVFVLQWLYLHCEILIMLLSQFP